MSVAAEPRRDRRPRHRTRLDVITAAGERWSALDADLAGPFDEIRRMVAGGGKRLRPAFCHWGFVGAGGDPDDPRSSTPGPRSS